MRAYRKTRLAAALAAKPHGAMAGAWGITLGTAMGLAVLATAPSALATTAPGQTRPADTANVLGDATQQYVTRDQDNLWNLSIQRATPGHSVQQWMVATLRKNPDAFVQGNIHRLRKGVPLQWPSTTESAAEDQQAAEVLLQRHWNGVLSNELFAPLTPAGPASPVAPVAAAPAPAPVPAPVPAPAPAAPPTASPPSPAAQAPEGQPVATEGSLARWWPLGLALVLAGGGIALLARSRQEGRPFSETVSTFFHETIQLAQRSKPKVVTVSSAAADMARSVERLGGTGLLVQASAGTQPARHAAASAGAPMVGQDAVLQDARLRLQVAKTQLELGRRQAAVTALQGLVSSAPEGAERRAAQALLAQLTA